MACTTAITVSSARAKLLELNGALRMALDL
jgi:hypothetical protein